MSVIFNKPSLSQDLEFSLQRRRNTTMAQYFEIFLVYTLLVLVASSYMKHFDGNTQLNVQLVENEYQALYDLYRSTNGWDWDYRESWNFTSGADPCNPPWVGLKCQEYSSSSGTNFHITSIEFYHCNMHGSLPDSLGTFSKLDYLDLAVNFLNGTIPYTIGNLTSLTYLSMDFNALTGHIPDSIGNLVLLEGLGLAGNHLTGEIPSSIGNLTLLTTLYLYTNRLSGALPSSIGRLENTYILDISENRLSGAIPHIFVNLTNLWGLDLQENAFTGQIPPVLPTIWYLNVGSNQLSGSLPRSLGELTVLVEMNVSGNRFSGWIPQEMEHMKQLYTLDMSHNALSGKIPAWLSNLTYINTLRLSANHLSGAVPSSLGMPPAALIEVYLDTNWLTGTIPNVYWNNSYLASFDMHRNLLTGPIPDTVVAAPYLKYLDLNSNLLSQTIPTLGSVNLNYLILSHNFLTGSLPSSLQYCQLLVLVNMQDNLLTGNLDDRFVPFAESGLTTIQLDDNQFTGTLPSQLFAFPYLKTLTVVGSCLQGTFPGNICNATSLETLILYGLHTGSACQQQQQLRDDTHNSFGGSLPSCLLGLPTMSTLILSANHLTGSIAQDVLSIGPHMLELDLSHNILTGSIPSSLQDHVWYSLDLSHNKFVGTMGSKLFQLGNRLHLNFTQQLVFPVNSAALVAHRALFLTCNRLSGPVPSSLMPVRNISVLTGNLLYCDYDKSDLPQHDADIDVYSCASNDFNATFFAWVSIFFVGVVGLLGVVGYKRVLQASTMVLQLQDELNGRLTNVYQALETYQRVVRWSCLCALLIVIVFTPSYALLVQYTGTHDHHYAYVVSAIYVSGVAPFAVYCVLWAALLSLVYGGLHGVRNTTKTTATAAAAVSVPVPGPLFNERRALVSIWLAYIVINVTLVLGVNIAFVYVVLYQSSQLQTFAEIFLSLFKIGWNTRCAPYLLRCLSIRAAEKGWSKSVEPYFGLQLTMSLFNTIAIPCLVVAAINYNCFAEVLLSPPSKSVSYLMFVCTDFDPYQGCLESTQQLAAVRLIPPFTYSFQCSASFVTSYATTFIYMSISNAFVSPLLQNALCWLYPRLKSGTSAHILVKWSLSKMQKPVVLLSETAGPSRNWLRPIFDANAKLVNLLTHLCILLTFGAVFTPVAAAMAVSLCALSYINRLELKRYILNVVAAPQLGYLDILSAECAGVGSPAQMQLAVRVMLCNCCAFYTLFLFDTLGDAVGAAQAAWVLIVVPLAPYALFGCCDAHTYWNTRQWDLRPQEGTTAKEESVCEEVEMAAIVPPASGLEKGTDDPDRGGDGGKQLQADKMTVNLLHVQQGGFLKGGSSKC